jgi:hypothetical protein
MTLFAIKATTRTFVPCSGNMGCTTSVPVEVSSPEALPTWNYVSQVKVIRNPQEPPVASDKSFDFSNSEKCLQLIFRQIQEGSKGNSFQVEGLEDELFHELQIKPAKPGILGPRKKLEDLVYLHQQSKPQNVIGYAIKNVPKGLNYYFIMRDKPLYDNQSPITFTENPPFGSMYPFCSVEFDPKAKIGRVRTTFTLPRFTKGEPMFTLHQCNPKVWVLKRNYTDGPQVTAVFNQWRGLGTRFTCWRLAVCSGEDPVLVSLLAHCIDSFLLVAKGQSM